GVKVTESAQLAPAATPLPQLSLSAKSPVTEIDEILRAVLLKSRRVTCCGWLVVPTWIAGNCKDAGFIDTAAAEPAPIFEINPSAFPPDWTWKADWVVGKSVEFVVPAT